MIPYGRGRSVVPRWVPMKSFTPFNTLNLTKQGHISGRKTNRERLTTAERCSSTTGSTSSSAAVSPSPPASGSDTCRQTYKQTEIHTNRHAGTQKYTQTHMDSDHLLEAELNQKLTNDHADNTAIFTVHAHFVLAYFL